MKTRAGVIAGLIILFSGSQAKAMIPVVGWGYSIGYAGDRAVGWLGPGELWSFGFDPSPADILQGRMTLQYNTSFFTVQSYGWLGGFGADPSIPAPPTTPNGVFPANAPDGNPWVLQAANANMVSESVSVDSVDGLITVNFNWGPGGYQPATADSFNFFMINMIVPDNVSGFQFVPAGTGELGLLGSAQDVATNGTNATTYMSCSSGYCGDAPKGDLAAIFVPEPSSVLLMSAGIIGAIGFGWSRRGKRIA